VSRGLLNYYNFADNYGAVARIVQGLLLHSCAKTLARKFKLRSRAEAFAKFGKTLGPKDDLQASLPKAKLGFYLPPSFGKQN